MPTVDDALGYAALGWPVFPCKRDKAPLTSSGVKDATTSPAKIQEWWTRWPDANIGFHPGAAGLMVLDYDPGADRAVLQANIGNVPQTAMRAATPRKGSHDFYALAEGEVVPPSASRLAPHIDVRCDNSYVLLAPSVTDDGVYSWHRDPRQRRVVAHFRTDAMVEKAGEKRERSADRDEWLIQPDLPENIEAAIVWLQETAKPAIEGQGGDMMTFNAAAMMRSYGLSEAIATDLLFEIYNDKCSPPWEYDELQVKVDNAYRYATSPPGNMTSAYHAAKKAALFQKYVPQTAPGEDSGPWARPIGDVVIPPVEPFVEGMINRSEAGAAAGFTGSFKTPDAIELMICGILGKSWKGRRVCYTGPGLYLALEDIDAIKHKRLPAAMDALNLTPEERAKVEAWFFVQPREAVVKLPGSLDQIKAALVEIKEKTGQDCVLVIIDTAREALPGSVSDEADAGPFMDAVLALAKSGPVVFGLGHISKTDEKLPLKDRRPKGLGDFVDRLAFVFMKEATVDGAGNGTSELYVLKVKNGPRNYSIHHTVAPGPHGIPVQTAIPPAMVARKVPARPVREGRRAKADLVPPNTVEVIRGGLKSLMEGLPGKRWDSVAELARHLTPLLAQAGNEGLSAKYVANGIALIRDAGDFEHFHSGNGSGWFCKPTTKH